MKKPSFRWTFFDRLKPAGQPAGFYRHLFLVAVMTAAVLTTAAAMMLVRVVVTVCLCRSHQGTRQKLRHRRICITRNTGVHLNARTAQRLNSAAANAATN